MTTIIAGMFKTIEKAQGVMGELLNGNFGEQDVCSFANNPPGQHATFPIGGDEDEDPGAVHADSDAGKGAAIGLGAGAAIGAYVGSLVGALHGLEDSGTETEPARRRAGVVVAVKPDSGNAEQSAISTLQAQGALHIEKADGQWRDGKWIDFDPVSVPVIVDSPAGTVEQSDKRKEDEL